ncbi:MAG: hydroxyisourate hydrolase [Microbacterium sp.]
MPHLTTHVLDATAGAPASGVAITLSDAHGDLVGTAVTDADGRTHFGDDILPAGDYALRFETGDWFRSRGVTAFYPFVTVAFTITDATHCHVPILLSPFAYSTYRGS